MKYLVFLLLLATPAWAQQYQLLRIQAPEEPAHILSADFGLSYIQGFDETENAALDYSYKFGWKLAPTLSIGASLEYQAWTIYNLFGGLQDSTISLTNTEFLKYKDFSMSYEIDGFIPTSQYSQNESMNLGAGLDVGMTQKLGRWAVKFDNALYGYSFRYATYMDNSSYNSPLGVKNKLAVSYAFTDLLKWSASGALYSWQQFDGGYNNFYVGGTSVSYQLSKKISLELALNYFSVTFDTIRLVDGASYEGLAGFSFSL